MAKFRQIMSEYWTDPQMIEEMTSEDKYFYLYLLTNPQTKACGIYQISTKQMALETGYSEDACKALVKRFEEHHNKIRYNYQTREIGIKNWMKYNHINSPKVRTCIERELTEIKDKSLVEYVLRGIDTISIPYFPLEKNAEGEGEREGEGYREGERDAKTRFEPPTKEDVSSYLKERNITNFTAEYFIDWYQARGWMIGKNKMKDWKAAVRTWEKNQHTKPQSKSFRERDGFMESLTPEERASILNNTKTGLLE